MGGRVWAPFGTFMAAGAFVGCLWQWGRHHAQGSGSKGEGERVCTINGMRPGSQQAGKQKG